MNKSPAYIQRHEQLDSLWNKYQTAKSAYEAAKNQNDVGHIYQQTGNWVFPYSGAATDENSFYVWLQQSDASLILNKASMDQKKADYESYKADVIKADADEFAAANPQIAVELAAVQASTTVGLAQVEANAKQSQAALDEAAAKKKKQTTIIIVVVVVVVVVGVGIFLYKKFRKKS